MKIVERLRHALIYRLAARLPDCKTITALMSRSLDENISVQDRLKMHLHKLMCRACWRYLTQIRFLRRATQVHEELLLGKAGICADRPRSGAEARITDTPGESDLRQRR